MELRPLEYITAKTVIDLSDRWHKTPDEILEMDASALYYLDVYAKGARDG